MMIAEPVAVGREMTLAAVPNILMVQLGVRVLLDLEVSLASEEEPEQGALAPGGATLVDILSVKHRLLSQIFRLRDHRRERLEVWPVVPLIAATEGPVSDLTGEEVAQDGAGTDSVVAEDQARSATRFGLREVVHPSVEANSRDATLARLHAPADRGSKGPGKGRADEPVSAEGEGVLALETALVLPWDAFWVRRVFAEAVGDPRVTLEVFLEEVHILALHLLSWDGRRLELEDLIRFLGHLIELLAVLIIEGRLAEHFVITSVKLARHFSLSP